MPEARSVVFARQVRRLREARGWSQGELARRLADAGHPIGQSRVSAIEAPGPDPRTVSIDQAQAFADALGVPFEQLLTESYLWVTADSGGRLFAELARVADEAAKHMADASSAIRDQGSRWLAENDLDPSEYFQPKER